MPGDTLKPPQGPSQERFGLGWKGLGWLCKKKDKTKGLMWNCVCLGEKVLLNWAGQKEDTENYFRREQSEGPMPNKKMFPSEPGRDPRFPQFLQVSWSVQNRLPKHSICATLWLQHPVACDFSSISSKGETCRVVQRLSSLMSIHAGVSYGGK